MITREMEFDADIRCRDGLIEALAAAGSTRTRGWQEILDARGLVVLPGIIDSHVHCRDPGQTHKEDFAHATRAAAVGGITTILDMPNTLPPVTDAEVFRERIAHHSQSAFVDFGLWGLVLDAASVPRVNELKSAGAVGVKLFWGFLLDKRTGALVYDPGRLDGEGLSKPASTGDLWQLLEAAAAARLPLGLHAEDRAILTLFAKRYGEFDDYETLLLSRPVAAEAAAIAVATELAAATRAHLHILHVSSGRGVELVRRAQTDGARVTAETCPHYLTLSAQDYPSVGPTMKVYPPIRFEQDQNLLWAGVNDGTIASVSSDHAPHSIEERQGMLSSLPAGSVGIQTMTQVLVNEAVEGRTSLRTLSWVLSEGPARLFGLFPQKGLIRPGSDADFTLVDPDARWLIDQERLHTKTKMTAWHGRTGRGLPVATVLRGRVIMRQGEVLGEPAGRWVRPGSSNHAAALSPVAMTSPHRRPQISP